MSLHGGQLSNLHAGTRSLPPRFSACEEGKDGHMSNNQVYDREMLGMLVRSVWIDWAYDHNAKPHHLVPWEYLPEDQKEVDRLIGERLAATRDAEVAQLRNCLTDFVYAYANLNGLDEGHVEVEIFRVWLKA